LQFREQRPRLLLPQPLSCGRIELPVAGRRSIPKSCRIIANARAHETAAADVNGLRMHFIQAQGGGDNALARG